MKAFRSKRGFPRTNPGDRPDCRAPPAALASYRELRLAHVKPSTRAPSGASGSHARAARPNASKREEVVASPQPA